MKRVLAITMGDPAGIGPEVIAGAWVDPMLPLGVRRLVVGSAAVMRRAVALLKLPIQVRAAATPDDATDDRHEMPVFEFDVANSDSVSPGIVSAVAGKFAFDALNLAIDFVLNGSIDAIVTAPLCKASMHLAGISFPGHTEILAHRCQSTSVGMLLYLPAGSANVHGDAGLGVVHSTLHTSLRNAIEELRATRIAECCSLADGFVRTVLRAAGSPREPRIGVAALNPHGGEDGLFGTEEIKIISPAVAMAKEHLDSVSGPYPCDTLMHRAAAGEFDSVVAMYHDQGHIALKLLGLDDAVNVTLGLPIVRTSVAHGTAFDIAWQGKAKCKSMIRAIQVAAMLAAQRSTKQGSNA